jgi:four helix bundle protein
MAIWRYRDLVTWQIADEFRREIVRLVEAGSRASQDFKYRIQILEAARSVPTNIAEGFMRKSPGMFSTFLAYSLGSLVEAEERLLDGIELGYFEAPACQPALHLAKRATVAIIRLRESQSKEAKRRRQHRVER